MRKCYFHVCAVLIFCFVHASNTVSLRAFAYFFIIYLQVTATRQLIQESMKEMEAHKAKRLAARSEMINLAKVC